jgi:hypothetical protein
MLLLLIAAMLAMLLLLLLRTAAMPWCAWMLAWHVLIAAVALAYLYCPYGFLMWLLLLAFLAFHVASCANDACAVLL